MDDGFFATVLDDGFFVVDDGFFVKGFFFARTVFFAGATAAFFVVVVVVFFTGVGFSLAAGFATGFAAALGFAAVAVDFTVGLEFYSEISELTSNKVRMTLTSLAAVALAPAESLTLPEGPLGSRKLPFSTPFWMARLS